jgi:hypothetical protein
MKYPKQHVITLPKRHANGMVQHALQQLALLVLKCLKQHQLDVEMWINHAFTMNKLLIVCQLVSYLNNVSAH